VKDYEQRLKRGGQRLLNVNDAVKAVSNENRNTDVGLNLNLNSQKEKLSEKEGVINNTIKDHKPNNSNKENAGSVKAKDNFHLLLNVKLKFLK